LAQRLTAMQQEVQSRTSLSDLILRPSLNLYPKERQRATMEDALEKMRRAIKITLLESSTPQQQPAYASAFQISFSYSDRYKAQSVVSNLVTKFIEQEVNVQRSQSNMTTSFLNDRLKAALDDLNRLDDEVTKFKLANAGRLPEQLQSNLQAVNSLETQLSMANEAISRIAQEKMMLETQLANQKTEAAFISSNLEQNAGSQAVKNERLIQLNRALLDLEGQLSDARQRYREDHPDVRSLEARLAVLKKDRDTFEKDETEAASKSSEPKKGINPQAAQTLESIRQAITSANAQIQTRNMEMEERVRRQKELQTEIAQFRARIEASPINEQRYAALQRDYQLAKQNYDEMSRKREMSETASNLEERKAGENLEILDAPSLPEQASEPNRLFIAGVGTGLGLFFGVLMAGVKEMKDTSLKNLKDVRAYTNLPVLSSIPLLENGLLVRRKRRLFWLAWSTAIIVGTIAMSGSMYYYYFGKT
jgi:uncharacterized protein involved in exopolysaccharide biosynthesis